jgi:hypothetical protein
LSAKQSFTIGIQGKRKKRERAAGNSFLRETANAARSALNYQNKEHGQNREHEAEAAHGEEEESVNRISSSLIIARETNDHQNSS